MLIEKQIVDWLLKKNPLWDGIFLYIARQQLIGLHSESNKYIPHPPTCYLRSGLILYHNEHIDISRNFDKQSLHFCLCHVY
jgi:hypothetical protein